MKGNIRTITCIRCKQKVEVSMYFYGERIVTTESFMDFDIEYKALVNGKAICPICGKEIQEIFHSIISKRDIISLATGADINN